MGSSRLPEKVLKDLGSAPMRQRVIVRAWCAHSLGWVVVATTTDTNDDPLTAFFRCQGFPFFRADPYYDVLDRYYQAASAFEAEVVLVCGEVDQHIAVQFDGGLR
jgi:spore coat polysaccharide biosynthesis protein SpsF (cytidylyltransferase family)